jgi:hypothetical protein
MISTHVMMQGIREAPPRLKARIAGVFYLLTIVMGVVFLLTHGGWRLASGCNRATIAVPVAPGHGRERTTMEGAGRRRSDPCVDEIFRQPH